MLKRFFITILIFNFFICSVSARKKKSRKVKEEVKTMQNNYNYDTKKIVLDNGMTVILRNVPTIDRKSTRLNSSHIPLSRMPSSA